MPRPGWNFVLVLLFCTASLFAQKPLDLPPLASAPPASASHSIRLNVVVTDKSGNPVRGLTKQDFTLLDDKRPTAVHSFVAHELSTPRNDPQTMILLIDDVNANFSVVSTVRTQIESYLRRDDGRLAVPVAIFLLTDTGLEQITVPSTDGNGLAAVLHQKDGQLHVISRAAGFYGAEERTQASLQGLSEMGRGLAKIPGRKLVVWIGPGWPIFDNPNVSFGLQQQRNLFSGIVDFSGMFRQLDMTVDSIDPLGPADAASPRSFLWESFTKPVTKPSQANPGNLALQVLAVHSGGTVVVGSNDITGEIAKCARDASAWYSMSIEAQKADSADTWHSLTVKVDQPRLKVRTLEGYYAQP